MKKNKFLQIFILVLIIGISYFFNYKEGIKVDHNPCSQAKDEDFCNKRSDCKWYKGTCARFGRLSNGMLGCLQHPQARCIDK